MRLQTMVEAGYPELSARQRTRLQALKDCLAQAGVQYDLQRYPYADTKTGHGVYVTAQCAPPKFAQLLHAAGLIPCEIQCVGGRIPSSKAVNTAAATTVQLNIKH